jgi:hypothetical protein
MNDERWLCSQVQVVSTNQCHQVATGTVTHSRNTVRMSPVADAQLLRFSEQQETNQSSGAANDSLCTTHSSEEQSKGE